MVGIANGIASGEPSMKDPTAFFITWPTYGTWLPGDQRGWVEFRHGWQLPSCNLEKYCQTRMTEAQLLLSTAEREIVVEQVGETCNSRGWTLFAVDCVRIMPTSLLVPRTQIRKKYAKILKPGVREGLKRCPIRREKIGGRKEAAFGGFGMSCHCKLSSSMFWMRKAGKVEMDKLGKHYNSMPNPHFSQPET